MSNPFLQVLGRQNALFPLVLYARSSSKLYNETAYSHLGYISWQRDLRVWLVLSNHTIAKNKHTHLAF